MAILGLRGLRDASASKNWEKAVRLWGGGGSPPPYFTTLIFLILVQFFKDPRGPLREAVKKNCGKAVRLAALGGVNPLQPDRNYL